MEEDVELVETDVLVLDVEVVVAPPVHCQSLKAESTVVSLVQLLIES